MKNKLSFKILISLVVLLVGLVGIYLLSPNNNAKSDGIIHLKVLDINEEVVFNNELSFNTGDSFYDILSNNFTIICADGSYNPDPTCSYEFNFITYKERIVLGIKNDDFEIISNWQNSFLAFYQEIDGNLVLTTKGVMQMEFNNLDGFVIKHENVRG